MLTLALHGEDPKSVLQHMDNANADEKSDDGSISTDNWADAVEEQI